MNDINYFFQSTNLQNIRNRGHSLSPTLTTNRIVVILASLALFVFASFAGCLTAYVLEVRKLSRIKHLPIQFDKENNDTHFDRVNIDPEKLSLSSEFARQIKTSGGGNLLNPPSIGKHSSLEKSAHPLQNPLPSDASSLSTNKPVMDENTTSLKQEHKIAPASMNDPIDVSVKDLKLNTYDAILNFLLQHGNQLKSLNLGNFNCTDDEFEAFIKCCPQIQHLFVSSHSLTDKGVGHLKGMQLSEVDFYDCYQLTDKALEHLQGMPLAKVKFSHCYKLTDKALEHLKGMPLASVNFCSCRNITDRALEHLKGMPLTAVDFSLCVNLTNKGLEHLKGMPLTVAKFSCCKITDLEHLKGIPLTVADFGGCKLTDKALEPLQGMPLTSVDFSYCKNLTDKGLEHLKGMPLTSVDFSDCCELSDNALEHFKGMALTSVNFSRCWDLTDQAIEHLKGMPLSSISFDACDDLTDKALAHLKGMPLKNISFMFCRQITYKALKDLKRH